MRLPYLCLLACALVPAAPVGLASGQPAPAPQPAPPSEPEPAAAAPAASSEDVPTTWGTAPAEEIPPEPQPAPPPEPQPEPEPVEPPEPEPEPEAAPAAEEPAAPPRPGARTHDGFYLRLGIGFTGYSDALFSRGGIERRRHHDRSGALEGMVTGVGSASELAIGGTLGRGFVLGGGLYSASVMAASFTQAENGFVPRELRRPASFTVIGPFGDWYFDPKRGLHAQVAVGLATLSGLSPESPRLRDRALGLGVGGMLGLGHEWWVGDEWSLGILGRVTAGILAEEDSAGEAWYRAVVASPSILLSVTHH